MFNEKIIIGTLLIGICLVGNSLLATCPSEDEVKANLSTLPNNFDPNNFNYEDSSFTDWGISKDDKFGKAIEKATKDKNEMINPFPKITSTGAGKTIPERYKLKSIQKNQMAFYNAIPLKAVVKYVRVLLGEGGRPETGGECRYIVAFETKHKSRSAWGTWGTGELIFTYEKAPL